MTVSLRAATKNVIKDKDFLSKYFVLVILSFIVGLTFFASYAKNYALLIPSSALAMIASIIMCGYDFKYMGVLIQDKDANLPEWDNWGTLLTTGLKFFGAIFLLAFAIIAVTLAAAILAGLTSIFSKTVALALLIAIGIINIIICICLLMATPALIYNFIDTDYNLLSVFNFKKLCGYLSINYFSAYFIGLFIAVIVSIFASATTIRAEYVLLYIIPLLIAPFVRMINDNLLIQAYTANKNSEKGSIAKLALYFILFAVMGLIWIITCFYLGKFA